MQQQPSLPKPALLHKLPVRSSFLHQCFFVWKRVEMLQLYSHHFLCKETSEKLPHGHVGAESSAHLWMMLKAGSRLKLIPTYSPQKTAGSQVIPILKSTPIKLTIEAEKRGSETQAQQAPTKYLGFLSFAC